MTTDENVENTMKYKKKKNPKKYKKLQEDKITLELIKTMRWHNPKAHMGQWRKKNNTEYAQQVKHFKTTYSMA